MADLYLRGVELLEQLGLPRYEVLIYGSGHTLLGDLKGTPNRPMMTLPPCPPKLNQREKTCFVPVYSLNWSKSQSLSRVEGVVASTD